MLGQDSPGCRGKKEAHELPRQLRLTRVAEDGDGVESRHVVALGQRNGIDAAGPVAGYVGEVDDAGVGLAEGHPSEHPADIDLLGRDVGDGTPVEAVVESSRCAHPLQGDEGVGPRRNVGERQGQADSGVRYIGRCTYRIAALGHDQHQRVGRKDLRYVQEGIRPLEQVHLRYVRGGEEVCPGPQLKLCSQRGGGGEVEGEPDIGSLLMEGGPHLFKGIGQGGGGEHGQAALRAGRRGAGGEDADHGHHDEAQALRGHTLSV